MATNRELIKAYLEKAEANDKIEIFGRTYGTRYDTVPPHPPSRRPHRRDKPDDIKPADAK
mgnify:CR=1 FL=1